MDKVKIIAYCDEVEIDLKKAVDTMTNEDMMEMLEYIFDSLDNNDDKEEIVSGYFGSLPEESQDAVLDDIICTSINDRQFKVLSDYFKKYGTA